MDIKSALQKIAQAEKLLAEAKSILLEQAEPAIVLENSEPIELVQPAQDTPEEQIAALIGLALKNPPPEEVHVALTNLLHSDLGEIAIAQLVRFNWSRLTRQVSDYLADPNDPTSFVIVRAQEKKFAEGTEQKIFIQTKRRNPTPVALRPDPNHNGKWRIYSFSL